MSNATPAGPTPTPNKYTGRYVTRKGDTFARHCTISGTTEMNLTHLIAIHLEMTRVIDQTSSGLSFLANMLSRSTKHYTEPLDEYQHVGLAAVLEAMSHNITYFQEDSFPELETLQMYHQQETEQRP